MKSKLVGTLLTFLLVVLFCVGGLVIYAEVFFDPYDVRYNMSRNPVDDPPYNYQYYQINPSVILEDITNRKNDAFRLLESEPETFEDIYPPGTFSWSQEDYLAVAKAHHLYLTGESTDDGWKLFGDGNFKIYECQNDMTGFDGANIIFYKKDADGSFPVTYMYIRPLERLIYSAYLKYEPRKWDSGFQETEVIQGSITADTALQLAEDVEGRRMRQKLSNDGCSLRVGYSGDQYWRVRYSWNTDDLDFALEFKIDANNGSYKVSQRIYKCRRTFCP